MDENEVIDRDARNWAMFSHLGTFSGFIFPFANIIVPLVIWLSKKDESEFVADQAKEALNFQISILIYFLAGFFIALYYILKNNGTFLFSLMAGAVLFCLFILFDIVITLVGAIKASNGNRFRYPLNIRFFR